jgi:hypothetical protein
MREQNMEKQPVQMEQFLAREFATNHFKAYIKNPDYLLLTGSEDTLKIAIPFSHRLIKAIIRQTSSTESDSVNPVDISVRRDAGAINDCPKLTEYLQVQADLIESSWILTFGDGFEYEATKWTFAFTGTSTDRIRIALYFQRLQ